MSLERFLLLCEEGVTARKCLFSWVEQLIFLVLSVWDIHLQPNAAGSLTEWFIAPQKQMVF